MKATHIADLIAELESHNRARPEDDLVFTGLNAIDLLCGGFRPAELIVIAAVDSGIREDFLVHQALTAASTYRKSVLFLSSRRTKLDCVQLLTAMHANVSGRATLRQKLSVKQKSALDQSSRSLALTQLFALDFDGRAYEVPSIITDLYAQHPIHVCYLDCLQDLIWEAEDSLYAEVSTLLRSLRGVAKRFGITLMIGSQLNRQFSDTSGEGFRLAHLRDSGTIEDEADIILFLDRHSAQTKHATIELSGRIEKFKWGPPRREFFVQYDSATGRFGDT